MKYLESKVCSKEREIKYSRVLPVYGFLKKKKKTKKKTQKNPKKQTKTNKQRKENNFYVLHYSCYFSYIALLSTFP